MIFTRIPTIARLHQNQIKFTTFELIMFAVLLLVWIFLCVDSLVNWNQKHVGQYRLLLIFSLFYFYPLWNYFRQLSLVYKMGNEGFRTDLKLTFINPTEYLSTVINKTQAQLQRIFILLYIPAGLIFALFQLGAIWDNLRSELIFIFNFILFLTISIKLSRMGPVDVLIREIFKIPFSFTSILIHITIPLFIVYAPIGGFFLTRFNLLHGNYTAIFLIPIAVVAIWLTLDQIHRILWNKLCEVYLKFY